MIQAIIFYTLVFSSIILSAFVFSLISMFVKLKTAFYQRWLAVASRIILFCSAVPVKAQGLENIPAKGRLIITANHGSFIDTFILLAKVPRNLAFTVYPLGFKMIFLRNIYNFAGFIGVEKKNTGVSSIRKLFTALKNDECVVIYNLSKNQDNIPDTIINLSRQTNTPVVQIKLVNANKLLPFNSWKFGKANVEMMVSPAA